MPSFKGSAGWVNHILISRTFPFHQPSTSIKKEVFGKEVKICILFILKSTRNHMHCYLAQLYRGWNEIIYSWGGKINIFVNPNSNKDMLYR